MKNLIGSLTLILLVLFGVFDAEVKAEDLWEVNLLTFQVDPYQDPGAAVKEDKPILNREGGVGHALLYFKKMGETYDKGSFSDNLYADLIPAGAHIDTSFEVGLFPFLEGNEICSARVRASWKNRGFLSKDPLKYLAHSKSIPLVSGLSQSGLDEIKSRIERDYALKGRECLKYRPLPKREEGVHNCETWINQVILETLGLPMGEVEYGFTYLIEQTIRFNQGLDVDSGEADSDG